MYALVRRVWICVEEGYAIKDVLSMDFAKKWSLSKTSRFSFVLYAPSTALKN